MSGKRRKHTKRGKQKDRRFAPRSQPSSPGYWEVADPFQDIPAEELNASLLARAADADDHFKRSLLELDVLAGELDPLVSLAKLAGYGLLTTDGTNKREWNEPEPVLQHHAEVFQAFTLRHAYNKSERRLPLPSDDRAVYEAVRDLTRAFPARRMRQSQRIDTIAGSRTFVLEALRIQTQAVRNPGFPQHVRAVVERLYSVLDDDIEGIHGVRASLLLEMWFGAKKEIEVRVNAYLNRCRRFFAHKTADATIRAFCDAFPINASYEELTERASIETTTIHEIRMMLMYQVDTELPPVFTLTAEEFLQFYNTAALELGFNTVTLSQLLPVLDSWSKAFGDLASDDPTHFFLNNPVWTHPLIRLDATVYFCPIVTMFLGFPFELLDFLTSAHARLKDKYERRRGSYLEEEVAEQFRRAIPSATVLSGTKWMDPRSGIDYENDILVILGNLVLVIEAKSGRVHPSAKRGAEGRLDTTIGKLIIESAQQATRFASHLAGNPGQHSFLSKSGSMHQFKTSVDTRFATVSVLLENFGVLNDGLRILKEAGFIDPEVELAPTITLYNLLCILELLQSPIEVLHYFFRRSDFERHVNYRGDELDLLAFYLDTGFNIGHVEGPERPLLITGYSRKIESWFMAPWVDRKVKKPRPRRTPWFADMLSRLQTLQPSGWTLMSSVLLNVSFEDQQEFEKGLKKVLASTRRFGFREHAKNQVYLVNGPDHRRELLMGLALVDPPGYVRRKRLSFAIYKAEEEWPDRLLLVIGQHCEHPGYPYDLIAIPGRSPADATGDSHP